MGKTKQPLRPKPNYNSRREPAVHLNELIKQQGVKPAVDLDEIGALWPAQDDPEAFLAFLNTERKARRQQASRRKN